jgi:hypothetical protein
MLYNTKKGMENKAIDALSRREHGDLLAVTALNPQWIENLKES